MIFFSTDNSVGEIYLHNVIEKRQNNDTEKNSLIFLKSYKIAASILNPFIRDFNLLMTSLFILLKFYRSTEIENFK